MENEPRISKREMCNTIELKNAAWATVKWTAHKNVWAGLQSQYYDWAGTNLNHKRTGQWNIDSLSDVMPKTWHDYK